MSLLEGSKRALEGLARVRVGGRRRPDEKSTSTGLTYPDGLSEVLGNSNVVRFVKATLKCGYADHFGSKRESETSDMIDQAFDHLQRNDIEAAQRVFDREWFKTEYRTFKKVQQPQYDVRDLTPHIKGERVLDYGSGRGYLALELARQGTNVVTMDLLDLRAPEAQGLPFERMRSTTDIPYPPNSIDTAIIKVVLHHVNKEDLSSILGKLHKVARRLIIVEETYNVPNTIKGYDYARNSQPQMAAYSALSPEDQFQALMLNDYFSNIIVQGHEGMPFPFKFKTPDEWRKTLAENGFKLSDAQLLGFRPESVHRACQILLVCDRVD